MYDSLTLPGDDMKSMLGTGASTEFTNNFAAFFIFQRKQKQI